MSATPDLHTEASRQNARRLARAGRRLIQDLAAIRTERGYTAKDVAEAIGIHRSGVSRFENREADPRLETVLRYAHAVGAMVSIRVERAEDFERRTAHSQTVGVAFEDGDVELIPAPRLSARDYVGTDQMMKVSMWCPTP